MTATLYNNGKFNHQSLIITRERNKLINNNIRLKLCSLINALSLTKQSMDYRYPRKILLQKKVISNKKNKDSKWGLEFVCIHCWEINRMYSWSNELQKNILINFCEKCRSKRIPTKIIENKYLFQNNDNEFDKKEFNFYKQRINDIIDPLLNSNKYWIPSTFIYNDYNKKYEMKINKNKTNFNFYYDYIKKQLDEVLGNIFTSIIPMFEWVLNKKINGIHHNKLNVAISIQDLQLKPMEIYNGNVHREGYPEENIVAAAVYYFDVDDNILGDNIFEIVADFHGVWAHRKESKCWYSHSRVLHEFNIKQGYLLVFNNKNINHSLKKLENISKTIESHRKYVVFMLVDPILNVDDNKNYSVFFDCHPRKDWNGNWNINNNINCRIFIESYLNSICIQYFNNKKTPQEIKEIISKYVIDNIAKKRENRNKVRFERYHPENQKKKGSGTLERKSYSTPWVGIQN